MQTEPATTVERRAGPLSWLARLGKIRYFLPKLEPTDRILDLGCADGWFSEAARKRGFTNVVGVDLSPPADIVGDIFEWRSLGLEANSFDAIIAFEVLEHGDFSRVCHELLKPDGQLLATTPVPRMDPVCQALEKVWLLQRRTSPHSHLTDLREVEGFTVDERKIRAVISQWGVLRPTP